MTAGLEPLHERCRTARRAQGITQSELARRAACTQSAISMFESGRVDALSRKTIQRIAERLQVDLPAGSPDDLQQPDAALTKLKYCPIDDCPSNVPYVVRGRLYFKPTLVEAPAAQSTRCALCGEVLEDHCPNASCNAAIVEGGACYRCGQSYVTVTRALRGPLAQWVRDRRDEIRELWTMSRNQRLGA